MHLLKIKELPKSVQLPTSKSIANRWLILQALYPEDIDLKISDSSDDINVLKNAFKTKDRSIDVGHAGTAMRFLTAYLSQKEAEEFVLTGSERMQQRPIEPLVSVLRQLGASIEYLGKEGYPPLKIKGKKLYSNPVEIDGGISSQFISALLLIGSKIDGGLDLRLKGDLVSKSYIDLTISVLNRAGIHASCKANTIAVPQVNNLACSKEVKIESDWSAASFWYGWVALTPGSSVDLFDLRSDSCQGDKKLIDYFEGLGVRTKVIDVGLRIYHVEMALPSYLEINLINQPDLAQPLAVVCALLGVEVRLTGLQTLIIKETNRLEAIKEELLNFGVESTIDEDSIAIQSQKALIPKRAVKTYKDHRMAMAFSLFASRFSIEIQDPEVVSKSYPKYFEQLLCLQRDEA